MNPPRNPAPLQSPHKISLLPLQEMVEYIRRNKHKTVKETKGSEEGRHWMFKFKISLLGKLSLLLSWNYDGNRCGYKYFL